MGPGAALQQGALLQGQACGTDPARVLSEKWCPAGSRTPWFAPANGFQMCLGSALWPRHVDCLLHGDLSCLIQLVLWNPTHQAFEANY